MERTHSQPGPEHDVPRVRSQASVLTLRATRLALTSPHLVPCSCSCALFESPPYHFSTPHLSCGASKTSPPPSSPKISTSTTPSHPPAHAHSATAPPISVSFRP